MSLKKNFLKTKNICRVTFSCPAENARHACLVGDFNAWDPSAMPMKKTRQGFSVTIDLKPGQNYEFRYFLNSADWANDDHADTYADAPYPETKNSVVLT